MPYERPSPFTIPEPKCEFAEGPPSEPPPRRSMTVEGLIHNLTAFADFYEHASAEIERAQPYEKPYHRGGRDANADQMQRSFRATPDIDRVRAYVLARYGEDLTIATARRVLGDLIRVHKLSLEAAGALSLETAMDRMDALDGTERTEGGPLPTDPDPVPSGKAPIMPAAVRNWLTARYLADPTPGQWRFADGAEPEPIVFVRYEDFADYLLEAGFDLLPNLDTWKNAGWIEEVRVDLTPTENPTDHPPYALARLNLPVGRHRLTAIRGSVIDAPTSPEQSNLEVSGRMGELPTGKVRGVVSLNVLRAHLEMLGFPDWRERFQSWPEVPILRLRCAELFTGQPFTSETIELLMAWFQERGLTPDQARHLPLSEAVRRLSPPSKTGIGAGESSNPADPPTKPTPSLLDQAKQFLDQKDREIEARQVAAKLLPYYFFGPDGPYARASDPPAVKPPDTDTPKPSTGPVGSGGGEPMPSAGRPARDPNQPGQDRKNDILATIRAACTPLTRPELVEAMRLKTEGKLGGNLAWMVANNVLINIPQRGYWPAGEPVPE